VGKGYRTPFYCLQCLCIDIFFYNQATGISVNKMVWIITGWYRILAFCIRAQVQPEEFQTWCARQLVNKWFVFLLSSCISIWWNWLSSCTSVMFNLGLKNTRDPCQHFFRLNLITFVRIGWWQTWGCGWQWRQWEQWQQLGLFCFFYSRNSM
jgi:hypothetical protein